jgi:hypothetical protein
MSTPLWRPSTATNFAPWQVRQSASVLSASAMMSLGTADSLVGIQRSCYEEPLACAWPLSMVRELSED